MLCTLHHIYSRIKRAVSLPRASPSDVGTFKLCMRLTNFARFRGCAELHPKCMKEEYYMYIDTYAVSLDRRNPWAKGTIHATKLSAE